MPNVSIWWKKIDNKLKMIKLILEKTRDNARFEDLLFNKKLLFLDFIRNIKIENLLSHFNYLNIKWWKNSIRIALITNIFVLGLSFLYL